MRIIGLALTMTLGMAAADAEHVGTTDPQIAGIVVRVSQTDIDAGELAGEKSHRKDVQELAQRMIADHGGLKRLVADLMTKVHAEPEESFISEALKAGGDEDLATLQTLEGAAFDKAYVDHEVEYDQHFLDAIHEVLIPDASNVELKSLLVHVEPEFVADLDRAKRIQSSLLKRTERFCYMSMQRSGPSTRARRNRYAVESTGELPRNTDAQHPRCTRTAVSNVALARASPIPSSYRSRYFPVIYCK